jgi:hypothetical protein
VIHQSGKDAPDQKGTDRATGVAKTNLAEYGLFDGSSLGKHASGLGR